MLSPDLANRVATWRQKAAANILTIDEMREAIAALRAGRRTASEASLAAKPRASRAPAQSAEDMLKDLEGL